MPASSRRRFSLHSLMIFIAICAFTSSVGAGAVGSPKKSKPTGDQQIELDQVVSAVQAALNEAAMHPVDGFPALQSVSIKAQTTISKDINGNFKLFVINIGGEKNAKNVSTVTFELKPPPETTHKIAPSSFNPEDIKNALAQQIASAKVAFLSIKPSDPKALKTDKVEIEIGFDVSKSISGGADITFTLVSSAELKLNGKLTSDTANTITLKFATE